MKDVNINNTMLSLVIHAGTCMKEAIIAEKIAYRSNVSYVLFCNLVTVIISRKNHQRKYLLFK